MTSMQDIGNKTAVTQSQRLLVRVATHSLSFAVIDRDADYGVAYEDYHLNNGISLSANLREAFRKNTLLSRGYGKVRVIVDSSVETVPVEEYERSNEEIMFRFVHERHSDCNVHHSVINELNAVALFSVNKDFETVITDHFNDVNFIPLMLPVWRYVYCRNTAIKNRKMFCYYHNGNVDVFCFNRKRFGFTNSYIVDSDKDALYFVLAVWKQLNMDVDNDELHVIGRMPDHDTFVSLTRKYIRKVYSLNMAAELNRAPITRIKDMPVDVMMQFVKI